MNLKTKLNYFFLLSALLGLTGFSWPFSWLFLSPNQELPGTHQWIQKEIQIIKGQDTDIDTKALNLGLIAYTKARKKGLDSKQLLTIIDFTKPSTEKRLWVINLRNNRILFNTWVSHGKNSGGVTATSFSNQPGSLKSSIGVFATAEPYTGGHGIALRLNGLEHGINDNAYRRDIVIHGAWYVGSNVIRQQGRIGRSWGCPAVSQDTIRPLINTIKENTLVFAYYPDRYWLRNSEFLTA